MSRYHENVTWQSTDGTWNRGFFEQESGGEFNQSLFEWVSTGHATQAEAADAWDGANPGHTWVYLYDRDPARCDQFDRMAAECPVNDGPGASTFRP